MKITITRNDPKDGATIGNMLIDGVPQCYTLEDTVRELPGVPVATWKVAGETAIPRGTYAVTIDQSARFGRLMPHVLNVPGFDGIRIHPGNTPKDTEGCILVGMSIAGDAYIGASRVAFGVLFAKMQAALAVGDSITLTIA